jgi:hypothetical protein
MSTNIDKYVTPRNSHDRAGRRRLRQRSETYSKRDDRRDALRVGLDP